MKSASSATQPRDTVSVGFVRGILSGLSYRPSEIKQLLEHAQIAIDVLDDAERRIPLAQYTALYRLVTEHLGDEGLGLFSRPLRPGFFAWLARACASAPDLHEALRRLIAHVNLLQDNLRLDLESPPTAAEATLRIEVIAPLPVGPDGYVFVHEWLLRLSQGLASWLVAQPLTADVAHFPYPAPAHAADYALIFAPRAEFDAPCLRLDFPAAQLGLPVRRDESALQAFLHTTPANITMLYRREQALAPRVRQLLRAALPGFLPLAQAARRLALSPRSLHRRLAAEGTSYSAVRDKLRHDLALDWLLRSERPVAQIAADLGFADSTSFYRAFAQREGCGPRAWRQRSRQPLNAD